MTTLIAALEARFTDASEIKDVVDYGCSAGVSGFIYSTELAEFFEEHTDEIEDILNNNEIKLEHLIQDEDCWTFQEVKEKSVWFVVENYCQQLIND